MTGHTRLYKRDSRYYLRAKVPIDLVEFLKKKEVKFSLGTSDHQEALKAIRQASAGVDQEFDAARRRRDAVDTSPVTDDQLEALAQDICGQRLSAYEEHLKNDPDFDPEGFIIALDEELEPWAEGLRRNSWSRITNEFTRNALEEADLILAKDSSQFAHAQRLMARAVAAANRTAVKRAEGDFGYVFDDPLLTNNASSTRIVTSPRDTRGGPTDASSITFTELVDMYMSEPARLVISKKRRDELTHECDLLKELIGAEKPIAAITRPDCRDVRDVIAVRPPNARKRWPKLSAREISKLAVDDGLAPVTAETANKYLRLLTALFQHAVAEFLVERSPANKLIVLGKTPQQDKRQSFSIDQLNCPSSYKLGQTRS